MAEEADGRKVEKLEEHFEEGSSYALKMHSSVRGMYRETHYWTEARLDGLVSRKEWFEDTEYSYVKWVTPQAFIPRKKIVEVFQGRDDRLVYRSVRYAHMSPDDIKARRNKDAERTQLQDYMRTEQNQPIIKITEKFERDPQVPAGQDVAKRRFHVKDDIIEVRGGRV